MQLIDLIITVCWVVFWIYWLATATTAKAGRSRPGLFAGARLALLVVAVVVARALGLRSHGSQGNLVLGVVGLVLFLLGLALCVYARIYLGRNWGMPMTRKEEPELVTTGPYRRVRHPIYTGLILAMSGTALALSPWALLGVAVLAAYFVFSATREEKYLAGEFPDTYPAYKRSTKMLIPFVF